MSAVENGKVSSRAEAAILAWSQPQALQQEPACSGPVVRVIHRIVWLWLQHYALDDSIHHIYQQACIK